MPDGTGFTVEVCENSALFLPATPIQYLKRMLPQNQLFGDDIRLEGVWMSRAGPRLVISQPDAVGVQPDIGMMKRAMSEQYGYRRLLPLPIGYHHSYSYLSEDGTIGLFDAHPANFVMCGEILVPIDVILVELDEEARAFFESKVDPSGPP